MKKQTRFQFGMLGIAIASLLSSDAFAHARFRLQGTTPPRNTSAGLKSGPCGNVARTASPTVLEAGQQLTLQWEETVNHPGYYRIAFSPANDAGFDQNIWVPNVLDTGDRNQYNVTITVPNTPCTGCTIQMIQYMTENNPPSLYYSCADIEIRAAGSPMPSPTVPPPVVVPAPEPAADCH